MEKFADNCCGLMPFAIGFGAIIALLSFSYEKSGFSSLLIMLCGILTVIYSALFAKYYSDYMELRKACEEGNQSKIDFQLHK